MTAPTDICDALEAADAARVLSDLPLPLAVFAPNGSLRFCNSAFQRIMAADVAADGAQTTAPTARALGVDPDAPDLVAGTCPVGGTETRFETRRVPGIGHVCTLSTGTASGGGGAT